MRLLSFDPGGAKTGTSGVVLLDVPDDAPATLVASWAVPNDVEGMCVFLESFDGSEADLLVCEHFTNRNVRGVDLTPCFVEGVIRGWAYTWGRGVVLSPAGGKNTAVPDDAMERAGFLKNDFRGDHHADRWEALRHALWYLKRTDHRPTLEKMFPNR